jgi:hypothetical protein
MISSANRGGSLRGTLATMLCALAVTSPAIASEVHPFRAGVEKVGKYTIDRTKILANTDLSAIVRVSDSHCVIGSDEGACVQVCALSIENRTITITDREAGRIELLSRTVRSEIDIEAVTAIGDTCYVMGSHGVAKKSGRFLEPRHTCFRFEVDPLTGRKVGKIERSTLKHLLRNDPIMQKYYGQVLQQRGVNIEGMTAKNGNLFIGFRAPSLNGKAHVIEIAPDELFNRRGQKEYVMYTVPLGDATGIREMVAIESGFLIVAGNAGSEPGDSRDPDTETNVKDFDPDLGFCLIFWDGKSGVQEIGEIPRGSDDHKVEAMTVLRETDSEIELLMLSDGPRGGDPTIYRILKTGPE